MSRHHSANDAPAAPLVHLAMLGDPLLDAPARDFAELAARIPTVQARLTDDAAEAGVIMFTQAHMLGSDPRLRTFARHPLTRRFPERVAVYDERDRPWGAFPGVYTSMPLPHWQPSRFRAWAYYTTPSMPRLVGGPVEPDLLFSFIASPSAPCREPLFALRHPDAVVERVERFAFWNAASENFEARQQRYRETLLRSRFVLCPRGLGTSSIRLFEVLAAGRVPVIISDDWVAPVGPDWDAISLRWPEDTTDGLVELLTARANDWAEMGAAAAAAHAEFFAPGVSVGRVLDLVAELMSSPDAMAKVSWRDSAHRRATVALGGRMLRARLGRLRRRLSSGTRRR